MSVEVEKLVSNPPEALEEFDHHRVRLREFGRVVHGVGRRMQKTLGQTLSGVTWRITGIALGGLARHGVFAIACVYPNKT